MNSSKCQLRRRICSIVSKWFFTVIHRSRAWFLSAQLTWVIDVRKSFSIDFDCHEKHSITNSPLTSQAPSEEKHFVIWSPGFIRGVNNPVSKQVTNRNDQPLWLNHFSDWYPIAVYIIMNSNNKQKCDSRRITGYHSKNSCAIRVDHYD